jgi:excisionase family DNA binding protein
MMMADMLTAKDMQTLLQVDRSTIYRMAEGGQLPAIKVGKQWRFPAERVNNWLATQTPTPALPKLPEVETDLDDLAGLLPLACVQLIQDTYADALGVMMVITDMAGNPITKVSNACGLFEAISKTPNAIQKCIDGWRELAAALDLEPKFAPSHLGLLCARGFIRVGTELKGMVFIGGIAPADWPPAPEQVRQIAAALGVNSEILTGHLHQVFHLDKAERARILPFVQRIANIITHIVDERNRLMAN